MCYRRAVKRIPQEPRIFTRQNTWDRSRKGERHQRKQSVTKPCKWETGELSKNKWETMTCEVDFDVNFVKQNIHDLIRLCR